MLDDLREKGLHSYMSRALYEVYLIYVFDSAIKKLKIVINQYEKK